MQKPIPKYRRQRRSKGADTAFVQVAGQRVYLGVFDSPESRERYARLLAGCEERGGRLPSTSADVTVAELAAQFWLHAEVYYRRADGTQTSEIGNLRCALRPLVALYGSVKVDAFGPRSLKAVRGRMVDLDWCRSHVNKSVSRIKHMFRWGVENEIVGAGTYHALAAVSGLAKGRSPARETMPKRPVPDADIDAVQPHVSRQVWALIQLRLRTGARGGELVGLRSVDIDTAGKVWSYRPAQHKTMHHGIERVILFGPHAQRILAGFMADRPVGACLFSPAEAEAERHAGAPTHRRPDQRPNARETERAVGGRYTSDSYRWAIKRGCRVAGVPAWSPHRLRHNCATRLRAEVGIDLAQTILGHRLGSAITEIYAEANIAKAIDVMAAAG